jgi:CDP-diacylglycerol--glycerol-3-phosphate 3-phosphatidyltransferase
MLTGANFTRPAGAPEAETQVSHWLTGHMLSSVQAWMLVVIMAREFIVSAVRGYSESQGIKFPATPAGKIKMFVQSAAICVTLYQMANLQGLPWAVYLKVGMMWLAVIVTLISGVFYIEKAKSLLRSDDEIADKEAAAPPASAIGDGSPKEEAK